MKFRGGCGATAAAAAAAAAAQKPNLDQEPTQKVRNPATTDARAEQGSVSY